MTDRRDRIKKTLDKALFVKKYTFSTVLGTLIKNIKLKMNFKYIQKIDVNYRKWSYDVRYYNVN